MTAPSSGKNSPPPMIKSGVGSFAIDPNFALNQTVKVAIRLRPSPSDEQQQESAAKKNSPKNADKKAWNLTKTGPMDTLTQKGTARKVEGKTLFHFDQVFDEETQTPLVYKSVARSMVKSVIDGKHATLFAYGQTGSGKTFTMQGDGQSASGQAGIIQLVVADLFRFMKQGKSAQREFSVRVCYVEVYNESIRDLLSDDVGSTASHGTPVGMSNGGDDTDDDNAKVKLKTSPTTGDTVMDCIEMEVHSVDEVLEQLVHGNTQRVVSKTDMTTHSPRSHAVFRIMVESREKQKSFHEDDDHSVVLTRVSDFNLVDLAGSENVKVSDKGDMQLKKGSSVNKSLLTLSSVIQTLGLPKNKRPKQINYQESKLTKILQPHLKGNSDMAILCCVSPSKAFLEETRSTLKFASMAKQVHVTPKVNEIQDDAALIRKLRQELATARTQVKVMKEEEKNNSSNNMNYHHQEQQRHNQEQKQDYEDYGYEDMGRPDQRQYENDHQQQHHNASSPNKNRQYVMPRDQQQSPDDDIQNGELSPNKSYEMSQNHQPPPPPQGYDDDEYDEYADEDNVNALFRNAEPHKNGYDHDGGEGDYYGDEDGAEELGGYDEEYEPMNNSATIMLDHVDDAERAHKQVHRYVNGRTTSDDSSDLYHHGQQQQQTQTQYGEDDDDGYYEDNYNNYEDDDNNYYNDDDDAVDDDNGVSPLERLSSKNSRSQYYQPKRQPQPPREFPMPGQYMDDEEEYVYDKRNETTLPTEDESYDGPEGSYADVSLKFASVVSTPDTLKGEAKSMLFGGGQRSAYGTDESAEGHALDGRRNDVSWDTMDLNTTRPEHVGEPIRAMKSIYKKDAPIPEEITIMRVSAPEGEGICMLDRLNEAEARSAFLQGNLDLSDDLVEGVFKDLERARLCIHDLVYRNVQLAAKLKEKRREDMKEEYQDGEKAVEQYWLLKGSMYVGLFFFFFGGYEYFMAAVILIWLILEANLST